MKTLLAFGTAALLLSAPFIAQGQDSSTLRKIGKAIQYPVNKAGQNASKTAHRAAKATQYPINKAGQNASITAHKINKKNSVTTVKPSGTKAVVTPSGDKQSTSGM